MPGKLGPLAALLVVSTTGTAAQEPLDPELQRALDAAEQVERIALEPPTLVVQMGDTLSVRGIAVDSLGRAVEHALWGAADGLSFQVQPVESQPPAQVFRIWGEEVGRSEMGLFVATPDAQNRPRWSRIGAVQVTVLDYPVAQVLIDLLPNAPYVGTAVRPSARVLTTLGTVHEGSLVHWTTTDSTIARIESDGRVLFRSPGYVELVAQADSVDAALPIRVVANPVAEMRFGDLPSRLRTGDVVHLFPRLLDDSGDSVQDASVSFSVERLPVQVLAGSTAAADAVDPAADAPVGPGAGAPAPAPVGAPVGASVDEDGGFVAERAGSYRVTAASGRAQASLDLEVYAREVGRESTFVAHLPTVRATDLWVFEGLDGRDYAYTGTLTNATMYAIDVTDPALPTLTDSVTVDGRRVNDVKVNDDRTLAIITSENASNRQNGITLLDIQDPAHPVMLTHYTTDLTGGVHNVWFVGDLVYAVNDGTLDIHIIDVSDPTRPVEVGRWGLDSRGKYLHDVSVVDGFAYLSYWNDGVVILDVGDGIRGGSPVAPEYVSSYKYEYDVNGQLYGNTHHAIRYGDYLFLGDEIFGCPGCQGPRGYVHVLDVSDITNPVEVASYEVPEAGSHNLWIEDDRLYVGYYQGGLRVVDVSGELRGDLLAQGREIARFDTSDGTGTMSWGPQPYKGHVFVSDMNTGLWIVRVEPGPVIP